MTGFWGITRHVVAAFAKREGNRMKRKKRNVRKNTFLYGYGSARYTKNHRINMIRGEDEATSHSSPLLFEKDKKELEETLSQFRKKQPKGLFRVFMQRSTQKTRLQRMKKHTSVISRYTKGVDYSNPQKVIETVLPVYIPEEETKEEKKSGFSETLKKLMTEKGFTVDSLAEASLVSKRVIERMRAPSDTRPSLEKVVAICIGMSLTPGEGRNLIEKAGYVFTDSRLDRLYSCFVDEALRIDVTSANQVLMKYGYNTLV